MLHGHCLGLTPMKRSTSTAAKSPTRKRAATDLPDGKHTATTNGIRNLNSAISAYHNELISQNEELLQTQAELEASRDRYARIYDEAPVGYMTLDRNGVIEEVNETATQLLSMNRVAIVHRPLLVFVHIDDRPAYLNFLLLCAKVSKAIKPWVQVRLRRTGGYCHAQLSAVSVTRPRGRGNVYLTALTDVTGRVQLEEDKREKRRIKLKGK